MIDADRQFLAKCEESPSPGRAPGLFHSRPLRALASGEATEDDARTLEALEALAAETRKERQVWEVKQNR